MIRENRSPDYLVVGVIAVILLFMVAGLAECCFTGHTVTQRAVVQEHLFVPGKTDSDGSTTQDRYYIIVEVDDGGERVKVQVDEFRYLNLTTGTVVRLHRRYGNWTGICYSTTMEREQR